jgi:trehalose 6-phosphate synthase
MQRFENETAASHGRGLSDTISTTPADPLANVLTAADLAQVVRDVARGNKLIVVSNREPVIHEHDGGRIREVRPASGMVTGIEPIVRAVSGSWIAHGSGNADRRCVDERNSYQVETGHGRYSLRRVWLTRQEEQGYYYGVANGALWPLCHIVYSRPQFSRAQWLTYRRVNEKFCTAVIEEAGDDNAIVFIQDYHLGLLPRMLRERRPDLTIVQFWHIPWPNPEAFRILPWGEELLDGLLGNDLLGFHIQYHCNNFFDTVDNRIEARVDREHLRVFRGGAPTYVRPFPISVDFDQIAGDAQSPEVSARIAEILGGLDQPGDQRFLVGVDRLDYTKGILERLTAIDRLFIEHPQYVGKVTLLQLAAPSRTQVESYRLLNQDLDALVDAINLRHQTDTWQPIRLMRGHHDYLTVLAAYLIADVLMVTSLHDGMNLVAKEFIAARNDSSGVLLLSKYTGAARELADAIQVNPFDPDEMVDAMHHALSLEETERREKMTRLRRLVRTGNVYDWGIRVFEELRRIKIQAANRGEHL